MFLLRTGCHWKVLPKGEFGSESSIHKYFLEWKREGVFIRLWRKGLAEYDEMESIAWSWQSIDGAMVKTPLDWRRLEQIRRTGGKNGTKRNLLVDGNGISLPSVVSGAQQHDVKLLEPTLDNIVIERPADKKAPQQHLCGDKAYAGQLAQELIRGRNYVPHVRQPGEEIENKKRNPRCHGRARRWVVERMHSWLNRFRKLLVRFDKTVAGYEGLLELACALVTLRQVIVIYG